MASKDLNNISIVGRLTRDANLSYRTDGTAICKFSIAVNRRVRKGGEEWQDEANFFDLVLWGKQGEGLAKYLVKGQQVAIAGELRLARWEKDGQSHSKPEIVVNDVQLIGSRNATTGQPGAAPAADSSAPAAAEPAAYEDDIPF